MSMWVASKITQTNKVNIKINKQKHSFLVLFSVLNRGGGSGSLAPAGDWNPPENQRFHFFGGRGVIPHARPIGGFSSNRLKMTKISFQSLVYILPTECEYRVMTNMLFLKFKTCFFFKINESRVDPPPLSSLFNTEFSSSKITFFGKVEGGIYLFLYYLKKGWWMVDILT